MKFLSHKGIVFFLLLSGNIGWAQQNAFLNADKNDPDATLLLDKVSGKLRSFPAFEMTFNFEYIQPGSKEALRSSAVLIQKGKSYRLEFGSRLIVCNGKDVWIYLKERNELQIEDIDPDEQKAMTPEFFLDFYRSGEYFYALTGSTRDKSGRTLLRVDFKPADEFSEYAKIGIDVDNKSHLPVSVVAIGRDGQRFVISDIVVKTMEHVENNQFVFNASRYPGIQVEDLRID